MSLTTLLLALLPAIGRPKLEPQKSKSKRERELEGEIDRLLRLNETAAGHIERLEVERDSARRRVDELQRLLNRAPPLDVQRANEMLNRIVAEQVAQQQNALVQAAYYDHAMNVQNAQNAQAFSQLGWRDCTCVPARHDALLGLAGL